MAEHTTTNAPTTPLPDTIDPEELAICLRVLDQAALLDDDNPDSIAVQRAVGHMFKRLKRRRRTQARDAV
ncbi:short-chain dehydrogenase, partial [Nocardia nova]|nr:short-chain dehydrogenase [Nocardia nova]